jgi:hypothetical protein
VTSTTVNTAWDDVICIDRGGVLTSYDIFVKVDDVTLQLLTSDKQEMLVTGLTPYSDYIIRVRYVNSVGDGPLSEAFVVQTLQDGKYKLCCYRPFRFSSKVVKPHFDKQADQPNYISQEVQFIRFKSYQFSK